MPSDPEYETIAQQYQQPTAPPRYPAPFASAFIDKPHDRNILEEHHLPLIRAIYSIPSRFKIRLPQKDETPAKFHSSELCFFTDHFKFGLRLPLSDEFNALMLHIGFVPAMLTPNAIAQIFCSIEYFGSKGVDWTPEDFLFVFETRRKGAFCYFQSKKGQFGLEGYPSSNPKWKSRYVFIEDIEGWNVPTEPFHAEYQIFDPEAPTASARIKNLLAEVGDIIIDVRDYLPPFMNLSGKVAAGPPRRSTLALLTETEEISSEMGPRLRTMGRNPLSAEDSPPHKKKRAAGKSQLKIRDSVVGPSSNYLIDPHEEGTPSFSSVDPTSSDLNPMIIEEASSHIVWNSDNTVATVNTLEAPDVRKGDERPSIWPMHYGKLISSKGDQERMAAWPKQEIPCRLMDDALRSYRAQYFVCQEYYAIKDSLRHATNNWEKYEKQVEQLNLEAASYVTTVKGYEEKIKAAEKAKLDAEKAKLEADEEVLKAQTELTAAQARVSELNTAYLSCNRVKNDAELKLNLSKAKVTELETELAAARNTFTEVISSSNSDLQTQHFLLVNKDGLIDQLIQQHADDQATVSNLQKELHELKKKCNDPDALRDMYIQTNLYKEEMLHYGKAGFKFTQACVQHELPDSDPSKAHVLEVLKNLDYNKLIKIVPEAEDDDEE